MIALYLLMPSQGLEPRTNGLCLPATAFAVFDFVTNQSLWSGLSLRFMRLPLSLYTFLARARLGSGLPSGFRRLGFPEFDRFYKRT
jgi:hypothetical protein